MLTLMESIKTVIKSLLPLGPMDAVGVGVINFTDSSFRVVEGINIEDQIKFNEKACIFFDLASLTKPLSNSLTYFLRSDLFNEEMLLCLNHRGGLPSWGLLPRSAWKEQILSYKVSESETLYSDFSALRVTLELEKKGIDQKQLCESVWDPETVFWTQLPPTALTVQTGFKNFNPNFGNVHDPNAWNLKEFCSHAGLFSTVDGLCRSLVNYQNKTDFIQKVRADLESHSHRFSYGWDRVIDHTNTLAGKGCGNFTFGHLGFTGTSIWIDPEQMKGHVILSNATRYHWFDKNNLNDLRRAVGELIWRGET